MTQLFKAFAPLLASNVAAAQVLAKKHLLSETIVDLVVARDCTYCGSIFINVKTKDGNDFGFICYIDNHVVKCDINVRPLYESYETLANKIGLDLCRILEFTNV